MDKITVRPGRLRQFGESEGVAFCLVTNSDLMDDFVIDSDSEYARYLTLPYDREGTFDQLLDEAIPEPAHVLIVSPKCFFRSPEPEKLGPYRKLMVMACNSTPTSLEAIAHFLDVMERTDPAGQQVFAERFFARGQAASHLALVDPVHRTRAVFQHLSDSYEWNQQAGPIDWGEQQIAPAGEISVLPVDIWQFNERLSLAVSGEVALYGLPILHSGEASFLREDQLRIFEHLRRIKDHAVIAKVKDGVLTDIVATHPDVEPASQMLQMMFEVDSRYRTIWEIGFAINTSLDLRWGNYAMNEVYGGTHGCLHFGLGLTPYTQYHLDIISPSTGVFNDVDELIFGLDH